MTARLVVGADYVLSRQAGADWVEVARLPGGAATLLPSGAGVGEAQVEAAIERAEDWLMPHAAALQGDSLEVSDHTGRLVRGLRDDYAAEAIEWRSEELEDLFLRMVDRTLGRHAAARGGEPAFIADVVLLRELAHHGRLQQVRILQQPL